MTVEPSDKLVKIGQSEGNVYLKVFKSLLQLSATLLDIVRKQ